MKRLIVTALLLATLVLMVSCLDTNHPCNSNLDCPSYRDALETSCLPYYRVEDCSLYGKLCANPVLDTNGQSSGNDSSRWIDGKQVVKYKFMCITGGIQ